MVQKPGRAPAVWASLARVRLYPYLTLFHDYNCLLRDLKLENLLIDKKGHIKIADFGISKILKKEKITGICGTIYYMALEVSQFFVKVRILRYHMGSQL